MKLDDKQKKLIEDALAWGRKGYRDLADEYFVLSRSAQMQDLGDDTKRFLKAAAVAAHRADDMSELMNTLMMIQKDKALPKKKKEIVPKAQSTPKPKAKPKKGKE